MSCTALAQRRQPDREDADAEPEVLAEAAVGDHVSQVAVRRGDDADVDVWSCWPPTRSKRAVLEHAQQSHLRGGAELADLVEEERAAVGALEPACALRERAREAAALVAEELGVDELGGIAPQFTRTNGPLRGASGCGSRARSPPCPTPSRRGSAPARRCGHLSTRCITVLRPCRRRRSNR
jgi:hypothetical protein